MTIRLNLGCGAHLLEGYVNVDKYGEPDLRHDLEDLPWPWEDSSVVEIKLIHVLEHLGQDPNVFLEIMQEMYRVSCDGCRIHVAVPHHRHDHFVSDPTHVRPITQLCLSLFSERQNRLWIEQGVSNSLLALQLGVDFEIVETRLTPSELFLTLYPNHRDDAAFVFQKSMLHNNLVQQVDFVLRVVKHPA